MNAKFLAIIPLNFFFPKKIQSDNVRFFFFFAIKNSPKKCVSNFKQMAINKKFEMNMCSLNINVSSKSIIGNIKK